MNDSFIKESLVSASALVVEELSSKQVGEPIGRGIRATVFPLGRLSLGTYAVPMCLKLIQGANTSAQRLIDEITITTIIVQKAPQLKRLFPSFMALVAINSPEYVVGILTEDVTNAGDRTSVSMPARQETVAAVKAAIQGPSDPDCLALRALGHSVAFDVAGEEKWLDLTPPPFVTPPTLAAENRQTMLQAKESLPDLTHTVLASSALVRSLGSYLPQYQ